MEKVQNTLELSRVAVLQMVLSGNLTGWQLCPGISGSFRLEWVAGLLWNQWQVSRGIRTALSDEFATASGKYFDNDSGRFASPHPDAMNPEKSAGIMHAIEEVLAEISEMQKNHLEKQARVILTARI